ncbi:hypothetical protein MMC31_004521 [Peltigera leucophlebia]|nr:hypothetical protein [Peltigera leucophlebia]
MSKFPRSQSPSSKLSSVLTYDFSPTFNDKPAENNFGALKINFERGNWAQGYVIEDIGKINSPDEKWKEDLLPSGSDTDRNVAEKIAGNQGLAAGKLYLSSELLDPTASATSVAPAIDLPFVCSGFCLEQKFFITTRHFHLSGPAALEKMFCAEHAMDIARISTAGYSQDVTGERESRSAYLAYENIDLDIAIFALPDSEPSWPTYVRFSQLLATDTIDYPSFFAGQSAFSVGYATNENDRYSQFWQIYCSMLQNHPVLKTIGTQPPSFQNIFHPFERILVLGKLDMAPPQKNQSIWRRLVGMLNANIGQGGNVDVHIIGMFKSGEPYESANQLVPFTTTLIDIVFKVCNGQKMAG